MAPEGEPIRILKNTAATKRSRELEKENVRFKRLLAEKKLPIDILYEVATGTFMFRTLRICRALGEARFVASKHSRYKVLEQNRSALPNNHDTNFGRTAGSCVPIREGWRALNAKRVHEARGRGGAACRVRSRGTGTFGVSNAFAKRSIFNRR